MCYDVELEAGRFIPNWPASNSSREISVTVTADPLSNADSQTIRRWVVEALALALILATFTGLSLWHARLGGFATRRGQLVGILVLLVWFSPAIDWLLAKAYAAARTRLFQHLRDWVGVGALLFAIVAAAGVAFAFALNPSGDGLIEVVRALVEVFTS